jgi:hypothetical protein
MMFNQYADGSFTYFSFRQEKLHEHAHAQKKRLHGFHMSEFQISGSAFPTYSGFCYAATMLPTLLVAAALAQSLPPVTTALYSAEARAARLEGTANAWVELDTSGKVLDAGLLQGLGMGLDD